ncbi:MAG: recombination regulator RecX [Phascolarctobacterium sp.]|nr:recombination regulator RecX [Phascolarctobacterium sp.]
MLSKCGKKKMDGEAQVYDCALTILSYKDRSGREMMKKLLENGADVEIAEAVVERLRKEGLIDERRYAISVYRSWLKKRLYGRKHLEGELMRKYVDREAAAEILESFTQEEEDERAEDAMAFYLERNVKRLETKDLDLYSAGVRFLQNRGFDAKYAPIMIAKIKTGQGY